MLLFTKFILIYILAFSRASDQDKIEDNPRISVSCLLRLPLAIALSSFFSLEYQILMKTEDNLWNSVSSLSPNKLIYPRFCENIKNSWKPKIILKNSVSSLSQTNCFILVCPRVSNSDALMKSEDNLRNCVISLLQNILFHPRIS